MTDNNFDVHEHENQLSISFELICLLKWILEHDSNKIKKIISKALHAGLNNEIQKNRSYGQDFSMEDVHNVLLDFFDMMEVLLIETLSEQAIKKALEKNLMPSIDRIDSSVCDEATVNFSIEKATLKAERDPKENIKKVLMEELLKRWKPRKKNILN